MIETKDLIFREYRQEDFDDLYEILSNKEIMKHYPKPYDKSGTQRWIDWNLDNYSKYGFGLWALVLKSTNEFIGDCGITMQNIDGQQLPEVGYHIHSKHWRKGYGKQAARAVIDWAFKNTPYEKLYSYMNVTNIASYSLASSVGMKRIKEYYDERQKENLYVYCIEKKDYKNTDN